MKNLLLLLALQCASSFAGTLQGQSVGEEFAMREFARNFMVAYNQQDIPALKAMYTTAGDTNSIIKTFEGQFVRENTTLLVHQIGIRWSDAEHALVAIGTYERFGVTIVYDISFHTKLAYRNVMIEENGKWKIVKSETTPVVKTFIYQKVGKLAEWESALRGALNGSGVLTIETGKQHDNPKLAYALLEWPSMDTAKTFFNQPEWQKALPSTGKGEKPVVVYLDAK